MLNYGECQCLTVGHFNSDGGRACPVYMLINQRWQETWQWYGKIRPNGDLAALFLVWLHYVGARL